MGNKKDYRNNAFTYWTFIKSTSKCNYFNISTSDSVQIFGSLNKIVNIILPSRKIIYGLANFPTGTKSDDNQTNIVHNNFLDRRKFFKIISPDMYCTHSVHAPEKLAHHGV